MPDINSLRLSPTLPSVQIGIDHNAGRIAEPPTWRVHSLSPLANSIDFLNNGDYDVGGEGEESGWEEGEGGAEGTHDSGEEGEDEGEGDDVDNDRDGGRWASLVCYSDTLNVFSFMRGTRIAF